MTDLPPNPYTATTDSVETRSTERRTINGQLVGEVLETISVTPTGARDVRRTLSRLTTKDGRVIDDKTILVVCDTCHAIINSDATRPCIVCHRIVCSRCIHRVIRWQKLVEVCTPCRWRTLVNELLRLS
jgi:hypothetical protein